MPIPEAQWERYEAQLQRMWVQAELRVRQILASTAASGFAKARAQNALAQIEAALTDLQIGTESWLDRTLPRTFRFGFDWTGTGLNQAEWGTGQVLFGTIQQEAVQAISMAIALDTRQALHSVSEVVAQVFTSTQQIMMEETRLMGMVGQEIIEGRGPRALARDLARAFRTGATDQLKVFAAEGGIVPPSMTKETIDALKMTADGKHIRIFCKDRKWRRYSMKWYSETVARTATRQAQTEGMLQSCKQLGIDLVAWTVHTGACPICIPLQGKVYSVSGRNSNFPPLTATNRPPAHPNCRHSLSPAPAEQLRERNMYDKLSVFSQDDELSVGSAAEYADLFVEAQAAA